MGVQARPLTGLPAEPETYGKFQVRMFSVAGDYLQIRPYPMDMSTWIPHGPARLVSDMLASVGIKVDLADGLREVDGVVERLVPPSPRVTPKIIFAPLLIIGRALKYDPSQWRNDRRYSDYHRRLELLASRDPADLDWDGLLANTRRVLSTVNLITDLRIDYLPRAGIAVGRLMLALKLLGRADLFGDLLTGADTMTGECNRRLTELARAARNGPPATHFDRARGAELLAALRADPACEEFVVAFDAFLVDFGSRETETPLLMSSPTWSDAPETVLDLISLQPADDDGQPEKVADRAQADLFARHRLRIISDQGRLEKMIKDAQDGITLREDSHFEFMAPVPMLRRTVFEMGNRLAAVGALEAAEDVLHLRLEELQPMRDPERLDAGDLDWITKLVTARKSGRAALGDQPLFSLPAAPSAPDALVTGSAASGGVATGVVRVIRSPRDFGNLQAGEIMVCPYTNPSWTPLFRLAAAVITDSGGVGSHAAIVAREYGIPAIMGTGNGSAVLADGQQVTVDGDHGQVLPA